MGFFLFLSFFFSNDTAFDVAIVLADPAAAFELEIAAVLVAGGDSTMRVVAVVVVVAQDKLH